MKLCIALVGVLLVIHVVGCRRAAGGLDSDLDNSREGEQSETCEGIVCFNPPPSYCTNDGSLVTYSSVGECTDDGICSYTSEEIPCALGCERGHCLSFDVNPSDPNDSDEGIEQTRNPSTEPDLPAGCIKNHAPSQEVDWIADFEWGTLQAGNDVDEYVGFFAFHDLTEGANMLPELNADSIGDATTDVTACSDAIMCVKNTAGTFDTWGAGVEIYWEESTTGHYSLDGVPLRYPRDLSIYRGVAFYALRRGGDPSVWLAFPDINTHPHGQVCDVNGDDTGCYNDWKINLEINTQNIWIRYEVLFSDLTISRDWGLQPDTFAQEAVYGMKFQTEERVDFDYCIDDIYLLR